MIKRLVDVALALGALVLFAPLLALAALGVGMASPGPILYRAQRVGRGGEPFTMYKLRTMHVEQGEFQSPVTAVDDPRVFPLGAWLRRTKVDELPQLFNVLRGDMAIVGPRPEAPPIVERHYAPIHLETLRVPAGLTSPGSLYSLTHGERLIGTATPEEDYLSLLFPIKLALDVVYARRASPLYDLRLMGRTAQILLMSLAGRRSFPLPPEFEDARRLLEDSVAPASATVN